MDIIFKNVGLKMSILSINAQVFNDKDEYWIAIPVLIFVGR